MKKKAKQSIRFCSLSSGPHYSTLVVRKSDNEGGGDFPVPVRYGHDAGEPNGIEGAGRRTIQTRLDIPRLPDMPGDGGRACGPFHDGLDWWTL